MWRLCRGVTLCLDFSIAEDVSYCAGTAAAVAAASGATMSAEAAAVAASESCRVYFTRRSVSLVGVRRVR